MAAAMVGDAALHSLLRWLLPRVLDPIIRNGLGRRWNIEHHIKRLKKRLVYIQTFLNDAEERQFTSVGEREWMANLTDAVYDVEDILDEMNTEHLNGRWQQQKGTEIDKVHGLSSSSSSSSFTTHPALPQMREPCVQEARRAIGTFHGTRFFADNLNRVLEKLDELAEDVAILGLKEKSRLSNPNDVKPWRETSSSVDVSRVVGREVEKEEVIAELLRTPYEPMECNYSVITIVGMGGIGKTTLAQLVHKDHRVGTDFDLKMWVYVSDAFNVKRVTREIIVSGCSCINVYADFFLSEDFRLNELQSRLETLLMGKRFLLVLDDVWTEKPGDWDDLRIPFAVGAKGSKIIVTTRSAKVSMLWGTGKPYRLGILSNDLCWDIFVKCALPYTKWNNIPADLQVIGREIVRKCRGLPLAAQVLGGMLRGTSSKQKWLSISKSELWDLPEDEHGVFSALRLSYHYLPSPLKRCFLYFSLFPSDYKFVEENLIRMWLAEGLLLHQGSGSLEDIGREYLDELVSRSLLQLGNDEFGDHYYKMHDLVHSLACDISKEFYYAMADDVKAHLPSPNVRHLSISYKNVEQLEVFDLLPRVEYLRTFLLQQSENCSVHTFLYDRLTKLRRLRVLQLEEVDQLPSSLGTLMHLRYLSLYMSQIQDLPRSICCLYNLQTLIISGCEKITNLPKEMGQLMSLQYLDLAHSSISTLPDSICALVNLKMLNLTGCVEIVQLPSEIGKIPTLQHLYLRCTGVFQLPDSVSELQNLQTLDICFCSNLVKLPHCIGNLVGLQRLDLYGCDKLAYLPSCIGEMMCPIRLQKFPIGEARESAAAGIRELRGMNILDSVLEITELQNVYNAEDAKLAELQRKDNLRELRLRWRDSQLGEDRNDSALKFGAVPQVEPMRRQVGLEEAQVEVLEALKPPYANLEVLDIRGYGGVRLPRWMGDSSYSKLLNILLWDCTNCESLSPLQSLPSLRVLDLLRMKSLKYIIGGTFMSLIALHISDAYNLEVLACEFPVLEKLNMNGIPKLSEFSITAPTLVRLIVKDSEQLSSFPYLVSCQVLEVENCEKLACWRNSTLPPMLKEIRIRECCNLALDQGFSSATSLQTLEVHGCHQLGSLLPPTVKRLVLEGVDLLPKGFLCNLPALQKLDICGFPDLDYLLEEDVLPATLESLRLEKIQVLPKRLFQNLFSLQSLHLEDCFDLRTLPEGIAPFAQLQNLSIIACRNFTCLPKRINCYTSLQDLYICECPKLESFPQDGLPSSLGRLRIVGCPTLKAKYETEGSEGWRTVRDVPHLRFYD